MNVQQSSFSGMMFTVGRLARIKQFVGSDVISVLLFQFCFKIPALLVKFPICFRSVNFAYRLYRLLLNYVNLYACHHQSLMWRRISVFVISVYTDYSNTFILFYFNDCRIELQAYSCSV